MHKVSLGVFKGFQAYVSGQEFVQGGGNTWPVQWALPLPAAPCRSPPLPAAPCRSLPLPAAPCRSLPLPAAAPCRSLPLPAAPCRTRGQPMSRHFGKRRRPQQPAASPTRPSRPRSSCSTPLCSASPRCPPANAPFPLAPQHAQA